MARRKIGKIKEVSVNISDYNYLINGIAGVGKEQPISEPVLTENGWTSMGDIKTGDKVFGRDGKLHTVTGVFPQGIKDVYKITFADGTSTRCGEEHLWHVHTKKQRSNMNQKGDYRYKVVALKDMLKDYKTDIIKEGFKYAIPLNNPIEFKEISELPVSPYLLGLLLGDGGFTGNVVTFTNSEDDIFERLSLEASKYNCELHITDKENHKQATLISKGNKGDKNELREALKKLNLIGVSSREKFIPKEYIYSSVETRRDVLSGLVNTDGCIDKGVAISFSSYSKDLASGLAEISRSLGFMVAEHEYDRTNDSSTAKYEKEIEYKLRITGDFTTLDLSKKHLQNLTERNYKPCKSIVNIEKEPYQEESQCIMIDGDEHLYITKDYIVTHNTTTVTEIGQKEYGVNGFLLLTVGQEPTPAHIGNVWSERASDWDDLEEIIDTIYEYKNEDYPELRMIGVDSIDEVFRLAERKVVELHNKKVSPADRIDTIKKAFGGYQSGENKVVDMVSETLFKLKDVGVSLFFIGHTKQKNKKDLMTDIEFEQITSNLDNKYYNCIKDKVNIVMCAYVERELTDLETMKDAFTKKQKQVGKIASEKRVVSFRDEEYAIDVKSHLEFIVPKCDLNSDTIIHELKEAMKKGAKKFTPNITDEEIQKKSVKDAEEQKAKAVVPKEVTKEQKEAKLTKIRDNMSKLDFASLQGIMTSYGVASLADVEAIPNECLDEILALI